MIQLFLRKTNLPILCKQLPLIALFSQAIRLGLWTAVTIWQLQNRIQQYILDNFYGEQPVGTSFIIKANDKGQSLIHTPSMRVPQKIKDESVIYQCMRSTLICAKQNNVKSIVIPLFGGGCGKVAPSIIAKMMNLAYVQINNPPQKLDWKYVEYVNTMLYVSRL